MGDIIQSQNDPLKRQELLYKLMEMPNQTVWIGTKVGGVDGGTQSVILGITNYRGCGL